MFNFVSKKTRSEKGNDEDYVVDSSKDYNEESKTFSFFQRVVRYFKGGEIKQGKWYPISKDLYDAEDSPEITYDKHP